MPRYEVEIGYAFYQGDAQLWETAYYVVDALAYYNTMPYMDRAKLSDFLFDQANTAFLEEMDKEYPDVNVAGTWLHNYVELPEELDQEWGEEEETEE